ncbi:MAG TPA: hypothetical protein VMW65_10610, partial [Chloroflexota bacterium]|nr:hypothetical protein [Chloroflexota bacterium]
MMPYGAWGGAFGPQGQTSPGTCAPSGFGPGMGFTGFGGGMNPWEGGWSYPTPSWGNPFFG